MTRLPNLLRKTKIMKNTISRIFMRTVSTLSRKFIFSTLLHFHRKENSSFRRAAYVFKKATFFFLLCHVRYRTDDMFAGASSKQVFKPLPSETRRYTIDETLYIFINYHFRPFLRVLMTEAGQRRLLVWLAVGELTLSRCVLASL